MAPSNIICDGGKVLPLKILTDKQHSKGDVVIEFVPLERFCSERARNISRTKQPSEYKVS